MIGDVISERMELGPGTILAGKYRYERDLGEGGMGRVVVATHLVLRERVAVKVLTRTRSPDAARRFLREARVAFRLTSPHVTKVLDAGQLDDGIPYIAMELLEGIDLAKLAGERGALPVAEACDYVLQACAGIGEAHALGIVHRDVKLANLFLVSTPRGPLVKVLDFGCAKTEHTSESSIAHGTEDGAWLGTPRCMAPEQLVSSRDVDARADVWALGVVLYTLIAGRPPFAGKTLRSLYAQIQGETPPPITQPLPPGLAAVIDRCLRKPPKERFADARALAVALAPFAKPRRARPRRRYLVMAVVALATTGVCASILALLTDREDRAPATTASVPSVSAPSASIVVASASARPMASAHRPAAPVATADDYTATPEQWNTAARLAKSSCAGEPIRKCFTITEEECVPATETIYIACLHASDRGNCMATKFSARFAAQHVHSKECGDF